MCHRIDNLAEREVQDIVDSKVDEYIEAEGMRAVDAIGQVAASVKRRRDEFEPSPNLALRFLKWLPVGIQGRVKAALTLPAENAIAKEIKTRNGGRVGTSPYKCSTGPRAPRCIGS